MKCRYSYLNIFHILKSIVSHYRLPIVGDYRPLCVIYIYFVYKFLYKGSVDFGIPGHLASQGHWNLVVEATGTKIYIDKRRCGRVAMSSKSFSSWILFPLINCHHSEHM